VRARVKIVQMDSLTCFHAICMSVVSEIRSHIDREVVRSFATALLYTLTIHFLTLHNVQSACITPLPRITISSQKKERTIRVSDVSSMTVEMFSCYMNIL
jgi:hypothetical protein